jgi:hypothetical protein
MITVSPTCSDGGFFINSDFVIEYYSCVQYIKTTMMPESVLQIVHYKGVIEAKADITLQKPRANESENECLFYMTFACILKQLKPCEILE